jgi:hypothetical protein
MIFNPNRAILQLENVFETEKPWEWVYWTHYHNTNNFNVVLIHDVDDNTINIIKIHHMHPNGKLNRLQHLSLRHDEYTYRLYSNIVHKNDIRCFDLAFTEEELYSISVQDFIDKINVMILFN